MDIAATLTALGGPLAAIMIALSTFALTQRRAAKSEERTAAKETVDLLASNNQALMAEVRALHERVTMIEQDRSLLTNQLKASEAARKRLHNEVVKLTALLEQSTKDIRSDVQGNSDLIQRASDRATDTENRLTHLESELPN